MYTKNMHKKTVVDVSVRELVLPREQMTCPWQEFIWEDCKVGTNYAEGVTDNLIKIKY